MLRAKNVVAGLPPENATTPGVEAQGGAKQEPSQKEPCGARTNDYHGGAAPATIASPFATDRVAVLVQHGGNLWAVGSWPRPENALMALKTQEGLR